MQIFDIIIETYDKFTKKMLGVNAYKYRVHINIQMQLIYRNIAKG